MEAITTLMGEHDLIKQFMENLATAVLGMEEGLRPPREFFEKAAKFAHTFADKYHHFKEEHVMFAQLAQKKEGAIDTHIETLRHQHERGRDYWVEITNSLDGYERGGGVPTSTIIESAAAYIALLRQHIHVEDNVFFPLARHSFTEAEQQALMEEFEKAEERCGSDIVEKSCQLVMEMGNLLEAGLETSTESPSPAQ